MDEHQQWLEDGPSARATEIAQRIRRHVEHAADLAQLPEELRAAFWRILEFQASIVIDGALLDERTRIVAEVRAIHADYPADVFPGREGQAARHVAERVLRVIDALP